jgi:hypothetical protein
MSSQYSLTRPLKHLPPLTLYPCHFTRQEAAEKQGVMVQTHVAIFEIPKGTCGKVVHSAMTDDGYSVAIAWQFTLDRPHDHDRDTNLDPPPDTIIDWFTKSEYERYLTEL